MEITRASKAEEERHLATCGVNSAQPATHGLEKRRLEESGSKPPPTVPAQSRSDVISTCMMATEDKAMGKHIYSPEKALKGLKG